MQAELSAFIEHGSLPENLRVRAGALRKRLTTPTRLTVLGLPKSGKSSVANLLLGKPLFDGRFHLPTTQVSYGATPKVICTTADGQKKTFETLDLEVVANLNPIFVEIETALPSLSKISLLEVVASDKTQELQRAMMWAAKRTDIAIWCTTSFNQAEQMLWQTMPDNIQDHSFLLQTMADRFDGAQAGENNFALLHRLGAGQFKQVLQISTLAALAARLPDGSVDKLKMSESGGLALIAAILREVGVGRQAVADHAEVFLRQHEQYGPPKTDIPEPEPTSPDDPAEEAPAADKADTPEQASEQDVRRRALCKRAALHVSERGAQFLTTYQEQGKIDPIAVLDETYEITLWLEDCLDGYEIKDDERIGALKSVVEESSELIQLLQIENHDTAVVEALSIMLQIKHDLAIGADQ